MNKIAHWASASLAASHDREVQRKKKADHALNCHWERDPATGRVFCHWQETQAVIASLCALR